MARYTCSYRLPVSVKQIHSVMTEILESCQIQVEFQNNDYIMGKETEKDIPFSKLVTIDIVISLTTSTEIQTIIDLVVKNEELALSKNNRALEKLAQIKKVISENYQGELLNIKN